MNTRTATVCEGAQHEDPVSERRPSEFPVVDNVTLTSAPSSDMQCPNAWLDVFACPGAQNIRSTLQGLDCERNRFSVVVGLILTEGLDRPNLSHAPEMALEATDAK